MKNTDIDIALIGAGRVAWHLGPALEAAGHRVTEVCSRTLTSAALLAERLRGAVPQAHPDLRGSAATLFLLAVPDGAVATVAQTLQLPPNATLAHTSGSVDLSALAGCAAATGVFYPLQTFSKEAAVDFRTVPLLVEGHDEATADRLHALATDLPGPVHRVSSAQRRVLHVAAVVACNFTNHLLGEAHAVLTAADLPFTLLEPLVQETTRKAFALTPARAQTGPAVRGDQATIARHLDYLQAHHPELAETYALLTARIRAGNGA